ncbi:MAG: hypothetical protein HC829_04270 [Bacteroidales bacterium]|nr:hypothetical protein [Bacteroidales bacterium]
MSPPFFAPARRSSAASGEGSAAPYLDLPYHDSMEAHSIAVNIGDWTRITFDNDYDFSWGRARTMKPRAGRENTASRRKSGRRA